MVAHVFLILKLISFEKKIIVLVLLFNNVLTTNKPESGIQYVENWKLFI